MNYPVSEINAKNFYRPLEFARKKRKKLGKKFSEKFLEILISFFPFLNWLPKYPVKQIYRDVFSGLATGIMCIPQSMAYALIAGLSPIAGLYCSLFPILPYFLFGTSPVCSVGPSALQAFLLSATFSELGVENEHDKFMIGLILSIFCGVLQLLLGLLRTGFIYNFLSQCVISGFTSACAVCIALGQLCNFLGIDCIKGKQSAHSILYFTIMSLPQMFLNNAWTTAIFGAICCIVMFVWGKVKIPIIRKDKEVKIFRKEISIKKFTLRFKDIPIIPLLCGCSILIVYLMSLIWPSFTNENRVLGIKIIGELGAGFPVPIFPFSNLRSISLDWELVKKLVLKSVALVFVGFMEHFSVVKNCADAAEPTYIIDSSQELFGLGLSNLIGGFFKAFPSSGDVGRTALAAETGAISQVFSLVVFLVVLITVSFLSPLFHYLPVTVLASVIIMTVPPLVDVKMMIFCFRTQKSDFIFLLIVFFCTTLWGVVEGVIVTLVISLVISIYKSSRAKIHKLGCVRGTLQYLPVSEYRNAKMQAGVLLLQFDYGIYFANIRHYKDMIKKHLLKDGNCQVLILSFKSVNFIDCDGVKGLIDIAKNCDRINRLLFFASVKQNIFMKMKDGGLVEKVKQNRFFIEEQNAVVRAEMEVRTRMLQGIDIVKYAKMKKNRSFNDLFDFKKKKKEKI